VTRERVILNEIEDRYGGEVGPVEQTSGGYSWSSRDGETRFRLEQLPASSEWVLFELDGGDNIVRFGRGTDAIDAMESYDEHLDTDQTGYE